MKITYWFMIFLLGLVSPLFSEPTLKELHLLSTTGSTRATAYAASNKIVSTETHIYATWLDRPSKIYIAVFDKQTQLWSTPFLVSIGEDNHACPTLAIDTHGFLYLISGPHHGPFRFQKSKTPYTIDDWGAVEFVGNTGTYASMVVDSKGVVHVCYRGGSMPRRLMYVRRNLEGIWSIPQELVKAAIPPQYTQWGNSLLIDAQDRLHLGFHRYTTKDKGSAAGYLYSEDGGATWKNASGMIQKTPVTLANPVWFINNTSIDLRVGNVAIDQQNQPWISVIFYDGAISNKAALYHYDKEHAIWRIKSLLPTIEEVYPGYALGDVTVTFDRDYNLYVGAAIKEAGDGWDGITSRITLLFSSDHGEHFNPLIISPTDGIPGSWLPTIERPTNPQPIDLPSIMFTRGGRGAGCTHGPANMVYLADFSPQDGKTASSQAILPSFDMIPFQGGTVFVTTENAVQQEYTLNRAFQISTKEVSNAQYRAFCDDTDRSYPAGDARSYFLTYPDYPVVNITYNDAAAYCNWLSQIQELEPFFTEAYTYNREQIAHQSGFRMPSVLEWVQAARNGQHDQRYPWGNRWEDGQVHYWADQIPDAAYSLFHKRGPVPVGSMESYHGLYHMLGNVAEWTISTGLIVGGSWHDPETRFDAGRYYGQDSNVGTYWTGFRIAQSINEQEEP
jgi:hypothetical protein